MKKIYTPLFILFISIKSFSINYYQTYDIIVTGFSNSIQCSVYDYVLQQTMTWNSPIVSGIQYQNMNGVVVYYGGSTIGFVTYDLENSQFETWDNLYTGPFQVSCKDGVAAFTSSSIVGAGTYDIQQHQWKIWTNIYSGPFQLSNSDGVVAFSTSNIIGCLTYNPNQHQWDEWTNIYSGPFQLSCKDGNVAFATNNIIGALTYDPQQQQWKDWTNIYNSPFQIENDKGLIAFSTSNIIGFLTYDPVQQQWKEETNIYNGPFTLISSGRVAAFSANNYVGCATYDPVQHQFETYTNIQTINTSTLAITNGTITYQDPSGNGFSVGYNSGNWNTGQVTALYPSFYLYNYNSVSNPIQLIHVRNMSIGATSILFDFGDGTLAYQSCLWHLYKVNGHYRTTSASAYNVCMTAGNAGGSTNTCQNVSFITTSVSENESGNFDFLVYPDPANDFIIISSAFAEKENIEITITDARGKKVFQTKQETKIDIRQFSKGIYFVELNNACLPDRQGKEKAVKKFIKN